MQFISSFLLVAALCLLCLEYCNCHSWIDCTDYRITTDEQKSYYDPSICYGRPRCGIQQTAKGFGQDTGLNFNPTETNQCQCSLGSPNAYDSTSPKAQYSPGQTVCLAYPAKNHVAATCTNTYIPDNGVKIRRTRVNQVNDPQGDSDFANTYNDTNGIHKNGVMDYKGFQNCPKFCENADKSLCTVCFKLEKDLAEGEYIFQWLWEFNINQFYSTCWDAKVVSRSPSTGGGTSDNNSNTVTSYPVTTGKTTTPYPYTTGNTPSSNIITTVSPTTSSYSPYSASTPAPHRGCQTGN